MDKPRHPHVVRTWTVERTRHPIHNIPTLKREDKRFNAPLRVPGPKPLRGKTDPDKP